MSRFLPRLRYNFQFGNPCNSVETFAKPMNRLISKESANIMLKMLVAPTLLLEVLGKIRYTTLKCLQDFSVEKLLKVLFQNLVFRESIKTIIWISILVWYDTAMPKSFKLPTLEALWKLTSNNFEGSKIGRLKAMYQKHPPPNCPQQIKLKLPEEARPLKNFASMIEASWRNFLMTD